MLFEYSLITRILLGQLLQGIDFQLGSFAVFLDILDNLKSHHLIPVGEKCVS
jgi:hypothetical protein